MFCFIINVLLGFVIFGYCGLGFLCFCWSACLGLVVVISVFACGLLVWLSDLLLGCFEYGFCIALVVLLVCSLFGLVSYLFDVYLLFAICYCGLVCCFVFG